LENNSMSENPDFVITCDHRGAASAMVARYVWKDAQGVWVPGGDVVTEPSERRHRTAYVADHPAHRGDNSEFGVAALAAARTSEFRHYRQPNRP
jgi:hypothetical protein